MDNKLELRLHNTLNQDCNSHKIQKLIDEGVDCNLSYFNYNTASFISPIQLAAKNGRFTPLRLLYKNRHRPKTEQLEKHFIFYIHQYNRLDEEKNELLLEYIVSNLLHTIITEYSENEFYVLTAAVHDFDKVKKRGKKLSIGSTQDSFLRLRIFTLVRRILQMRIETTIETDNEELITMKNKELIILKNELLHNLETYYLLYDIEHIPVVKLQEFIRKKFTEIEPYQPILIKYYKCIAENIIGKIKQLEVDQEYTIPSGWRGHAVCISFRRINKTHIHIRVDNSSSLNPIYEHEVNDSRKNYHQIKPKILGWLHLYKLDDNLNYFILLIDSVKRDLSFDEGVSLIYNHNKQILHLDETRAEDIPTFLEQADTNCFMKCFEPGFRIRFGKIRQKLCEKIIAFDEDNVNLLRRRAQSHFGSVIVFYMDFARLAKQCNENRLPIEDKTRLKTQLIGCYKQHYQYRRSIMTERSCNSFMEKYIPLKFKKDDIEIKLEDLFIESRVLVLGDAGCGKTTICQHITYSWSCEKLCKSKFEWLFYINLRNLNSKLYPPTSKNYSLINIIERECFQGYKLSYLDKQKLTSLFENPSKILWILDGLDERTIPDHLYLIEQELLTKPYLLLTARPSVTYDFQYDTQVRIQGFSSVDDIKSFIMKYFPALFLKEATGCYSCICSSEQLLQIARIPACLEIMCNLWQNNKEIFSSSMTTGQLYEKMSEYLLRRYLRKFHGLCTSAIGTTNIFQQPNIIGFYHLEYLAFVATKSHRFTINGNEISDIAIEEFLSVIHIGLLLPEIQNSSMLFVDNDFYFIHRSFQEYLCARYMIRVLTKSSSKEQHEEVFQFIANKKYDRRIQDTFRLFFELKRSDECTNQFWRAVDNEPRDLVGLRHCSRIIQWFPYGSYIFPFDEEKHINKRTTDVVLAWMLDQDRRAHDFGNTYLFEWFFRAMPHYCWLFAWKEDLFLEDPSKRRYFLPDVWSTKNIDTLKSVYDQIQGTNVQALHRLIQTGPTLINLERLHLNPDLFILHTIDNQGETSQVLIDAQKKARERQSITAPTEFQALLENYTSFANLNHQTLTSGIIIWRLKVTPSALKNIDRNTLELLLRLTQENTLFYRNFLLPAIPFLKLYARQNASNDDILCLLIVSISFSSECILTAPVGERKLIRIRENEKFDDTELSESRWHKLINAFDCARRDYGYSCFFAHSD